MLTEDRNIKIIDFGYAREEDKMMSPNMGTEIYNPPEVSGILLELLSVFVTLR